MNNSTAFNDYYLTFLRPRTTMNEIILSYRLTICRASYILNALSTHLKVGIETPRKGHKRPLSNVVFLYPSKTQALIRLVSPVMVGSIEQPVKRLAGSFVGSLNLIHSPSPKDFRHFSGGYSLLQRNLHDTK